MNEVEETKTIIAKVFRASDIDEDGNDVWRCVPFLATLTEAERKRLEGAFAFANDAEPLCEFIVNPDDSTGRIPVVVHFENVRFFGGFTEPVDKSLYDYVPSVVEL
jgi:hypothetical protein